MPVSKTIGACVGLVKLEGTAEAEAPVVSTLTQTRCVYYKWRVDEHWIRYVKETYEENGRQKTRMVKKEGADTVASGSDRNLFYLKDEYGVIQIRPNWANLVRDNFFIRAVGPNNPLYYKHAPDKRLMDQHMSGHFMRMGLLYIALYTLKGTPGPGRTLLPLR